MKWAMAAGAGIVGGYLLTSVVAGKAYGWKEIAIDAAIGMAGLWALERGGWVPAIKSTVGA